MARLVEVKVWVFVKDAGPRPIEALNLSGSIKRKKLSSFGEDLLKALTRLGLQVTKQAGGREHEFAYRVPAAQWNVSGVRERVQEIIEERFEFPLDSIFGP